VAILAVLFEQVTLVTTFEPFPKQADKNDNRRESQQHKDADRAHMVATGADEDVRATARYNTADEIDEDRDAAEPHRHQHRRSEHLCCAPQGVLRSLVRLTSWR